MNTTPGTNNCPSVLTSALVCAASLLLLSACAAEAPSADGSIVDLHLTQASVKQECDVISTVPYAEDCERVRQPDECFVYVEAPTGGFVRAQVWCDTFEDLKVGQEFSDGTNVIDSACAEKDDNGRWRTIGGTDDCASLTAGHG